MLLWRRSGLASPIQIDQGGESVGNGWKYDDGGAKYEGRRFSAGQGRRETRNPVGKDKVLETLFTSSSREQPTISRYSRTPVAQGSLHATTPIAVPSLTPTHAPALPPTPPIIPTSTATPTKEIRIAAPSEVPEPINRGFDSLRDLLQQKDAPLDQIWQGCCKALGDRERKAVFERQDKVAPKDIALLEEALDAVCKRGSSGLQDEHGITPSAAVRLYLQSGVMRSSWWHLVLLTMLGRLITLMYAGTAREYDHAKKHQLQWLLLETTEVWRLYLKRCANQIPRGSSNVRNDGGPGIHQGLGNNSPQNFTHNEELWLGWPDFVCARKDLHKHPQLLTARFLSFLPTDHTSDTLGGIPRSNMKKSLFNVNMTAAAAAMTRDCIGFVKNTPGLGEICPDNAAPLFEFLDSAVGEPQSVARRSMSQLVGSILAKDGVPKDVIQQALKHWSPPAQSRAVSPQPLVQPVRASTKPGNTSPVSAYGAESPAVHKSYSRTPPSAYGPRNGANNSTPGVDWMSSLMIDMDGAVKRSNAKSAVQVWKRAQRDLGNERLVGTPAKLDNLYTQFLSSFFELKRAETAISVWNFMVQKGHNITKVHWSAMLHGCIRVHDVSSLQEIWGNMRKSNIAPRYCDLDDIYPRLDQVQTVARRHRCA